MWVGGSWRWFKGVVGNNLSEQIYYFMLFLVLCLFLFLRGPYVYGMKGFGMLVLLLMLPLFLSQFVCRVLLGTREFMGGLVPVGSPLWIAPFVCVVELVSYLIRPVVLLIRPFVKLSVGVLLGGAMGLLSFSLDERCFFLFYILILYEMFVTLVHWYIVREMLGFSVFH